MRSASVRLRERRVRLLAEELGEEGALDPFFESQRAEIQEQQDSDPDVTILKSIWAPAHEGRPVRIDEIRTRVNALLVSQGATRELSGKQIGWRLRHWGPSRERTAEYKFLRFTPELIGLVHRLAERFELSLPHYENCHNCKPAGVEAAGV